MLTLPHDIGDYTLEALIGSGPDNRYVYQARQKGTDRQVMLELLNESESSAEDVNAFLEEVRAKTKASEKLSFVGTVFEARQKDGYLFFTYQNEEGKSIVELAAESGTLPSALLLQIVDTIAQSRMAFEEMDIACVPVSLDQFRVTSAGKVLMENTALGGPPSADEIALDLKITGEILFPLVTTGLPGATRLHTLFTWMVHGTDGQILTWGQVHELVVTVQEQLGLAPENATLPISHSKINWKKYLIPGAIAAVVISLVAILAANRPTPPPPPPVKPKPTLSLEDHSDVKLSIPGREAPILCDAHEVTIKAYKRFLDSLSNMPENVRLRDFAHPDQPADKKNYIPENWDAIISAAGQNGTWNGIPLSMSSPVFNVDWWDAYAYAKWKHRRLPTKDEWKAIATIAAPSGKADPYGPVEEYSEDLGADNLCGFASGVSEWTDTVEENPNQPMEPPQYVICGGNYSMPGAATVTYEPNPNLHGTAIGFRTVSDKIEPKEKQ